MDEMTFSILAVLQQETIVNLQYTRVGVHLYLTKRYTITHGVEPPMVAPRSKTERIILC